MKFFRNTLLACLFLSVQVFAVAHAATSDARDHQHKDVECSICIHASDAQKVLGAALFFGPDLILAHSVEPKIFQNGISFAISNTQHIRAPPVSIQHS
ncbi:MAG: hypothetical protein COA47_02550 [Robiginitomaculum sp.]|nr:MAG: hypothetical protein COA47_02550 [Robiginitomaculum sp.]